MNKKNENQWRQNKIKERLKVVSDRIKIGIPKEIIKLELRKA